MNKFKKGDKVIITGLPAHYSENFLNKEGIIRGGPSHSLYAVHVTGHTRRLDLFLTEEQLKPFMEKELKYKPDMLVVSTETGFSGQIINVDTLREHPYHVRWGSGISSYCKIMELTTQAELDIPLKVGQRVMRCKNGEQGTVIKITSGPLPPYQIQWDTKGHNPSWVFRYQVTPIEQDTMKKQVELSLAEAKKFYKSSTDEGFKALLESTFGKEELIKEEVTLPMSYEELGLIKGYYLDGKTSKVVYYSGSADEGLSNLFPSEYIAKAVRAYAKLCQLYGRWTEKQSLSFQTTSYTITKEIRGKLLEVVAKDNLSLTTVPFEFASKELRDQFMQQFKGLLEEAKILL